MIYSSTKHSSFHIRSSERFTSISNRDFSADVIFLSDLERNSNPSISDPEPKIANDCGSKDIPGSKERAILSRVAYVISSELHGRGRIRNYKKAISRRLMFLFMTLERYKFQFLTHCLTRVDPHPAPFLQMLRVVQNLGIEGSRHLRRRTRQHPGTESYRRKAVLLLLSAIWQPRISSQR